MFNRKYANAFEFRAKHYPNDGLNPIRDEYLFHKYNMDGRIHYVFWIGYPKGNRNNPKVGIDLGASRIFISLSDFLRDYPEAKAYYPPRSEKAKDNYVY